MGLNIDNGFDSCSSQLKCVMSPLHKLVSWHAAKIDEFAWVSPAANCIC